MNAVSLVLIVHDHQPVGNFDGVFRQAYADAYEPFLTFLERHPRLRLALHASGPLLEWIASHEPDYLARLRALVDRDQVELWGGGFYEPILPSIPEPDRRGQILAMADWLENELGRRPRGAWLAERVWEPGLAASLNSAGVEYTAVDDAHFVAAGLERDRLWGYFHTEDQGLGVKVFPIHRELRYLVPFEAPERTLEMLRRVSESGEGRIAVLGDDGEKFGSWPGTHELCYGEGWLERWAELLESESWIEFRTPAEAIERHPPLGLAYIPSAAYHEMQEWSLPPDAQKRYHRAAERLRGEFGDVALDLLRGGHWRNFQTRYPESNRLHKRALRASRLLWRRNPGGDSGWGEARTRLWRAQCNCPYWHGVFGGLYLPHLRSAVYRELIAAERFLAPKAPHVEFGDLDLDGVDDALLELGRWAAWVSAQGGRLWAFDDREGLKNYGDTVSRRPEPYHDQLEKGVAEEEGSRTVQGPMQLKDASVGALLRSYDTRGRDSFLDRWEEGGAVHDWALERFRLVRSEQSQILLERGESQAPGIEKRYLAGADEELEVVYTLRAAGRRTGILVVDLNLGLHVPQADDRYVEVQGRRAEPPHLSARASHADVTHSAFVDGFAGLRLDIRTDRGATLERSPIETVSSSEGGAERVFQGLQARYRFPVTLEPELPWVLRFRLDPGISRRGGDDPR